MFSSVSWPSARLTANALTEPDSFSSTRSVSFVEYMRLPSALIARQFGLVPISTTPRGVSEPVARSTSKR